MALNTANTSFGDILLFNGEVILCCSHNTVVMSFQNDMNEALRGKKKGLLFLTSHRIIFKTRNNPSFVTFSMPFSTLSSVDLKQPICGPTYLCGVTTPQPGSNLTGTIPWRLTFPSGGGIIFGRSLLRAVDMAESYCPQVAPPPYVVVGVVYYTAPPQYCQAPQGGYNGFQPPPLYAQRTQESVYVQEAPPPYPGIGPDCPPVPKEQLTCQASSSERPPPPPYSQAA